MSLGMLLYPKGWFVFYMIMKCLKVFISIGTAADCAL